MYTSNRVWQWSFGTNICGDHNTLHIVKPTETIHNEKHM